jgi:hypothetical protein
MKGRPFIGVLVPLVMAIVFVPGPLQAGDEPPSNEFRFTLSPYHPLKGNLVGSAQLGYYYNPDEEYSEYYLGWPGLVYTVKGWLQLWAGVHTTYTDHRQNADLLEPRPFAGVKFFVPNRAQINLYNFTRYEYRMTLNLDSGDWNYVNRVRSRFGVEIPFARREKAWKERTFYGTADVEPFYRFDTDVIDPLRLRGGVGYVFNDRLRLEFIYYAQFSREDGNGPLEYGENIFRLDMKLGLSRGILQRARGAVLLPKQMLEQWRP